VLDVRASEDKGLVVIPANFASGEYRMFALRGEASFPIGVATITVQDNISQPHKTRVIAHRGVHSTAVENSLESFIAAQELEGVYGSEFDVYITADGYVVSNHDATYKGDNGATVRIETTNYEDLPLRKGEKLPKLEAYFEQALKNPGCKLIIEIKSHPTPEQESRVVKNILAAVKKYKLTKHVEYIAFSKYVCDELVKYAPKGTQIAYLNGDIAPAKCKELGYTGIDYNINVLKKNPDWIKQCHDLGMTVNVWTVNDTETMQWFIDQGVDYITTDNPLELNRLLGK
jgi:glycerophosphoryl diester phosphodiesterase